MPVADAPEDDDVRETYNFAPGYHGLVYRADVPDYGAGEAPHESDRSTHGGAAEKDKHMAYQPAEVPGEIRYKLQAMKWGLIPFWTKRNPDYGSVMKTINARDDSLAAKGGMWNTMKQRKRCIVVAQGFYEWLKKNGGKEKVPHFMKRKDEQLMCFAGLWDCVRYEGSDEKHYTYTIITTDSNKQLSFLHDRMPVILENGTDEIRTWLDPHRSEWSKDLQSLLKPYQGALECYPVSKDVGKVGNNSPSFLVPVASSANKNNIANFFGNAQKADKDSKTARHMTKNEDKNPDIESPKGKIKEEDRSTVDHDSSENHAPLPVPVTETAKRGIKRELETGANEGPTFKSIKTEDRVPSTDDSNTKPAEKSQSQTTPTKKTRSAIQNGATKKSPAKSEGSQQITKFFK